MKVPMAFCLNCGWVTQDLDELDAHTAECQGQPTIRARDVACRCGARPGQRCISSSGRFHSQGNEHTWRWKQVSLR
jgi:hypothetical protein